MSPQRKAPRRKSGPPTQTPATWISARARNALRRPWFITTVGGLTFICAVAALWLVPRQAKRAALAGRTVVVQRPDTESTVAAMNEARRQVAAADSNIIATRARLSELVAASAAAAARDTSADGALLPGEVRRRRDSLAAEGLALEKLIERSQNAPLLGAYRALAQAPAMQGDPRVKPMLDSLAELERERDSFSAVGGVDPAFVALTARANALGKSIETLAIARREVMKAEANALAPPAPVIATAVASQAFPDTIAAIQKRDEARTVAAGVGTRLERERAELIQLDARDARANDFTSLSASSSAILAAALVFGAMLGFGVALFDEVRNPRVADMFEAERTTGLRVLGTVRPLPAVAERRRRSTDYGGPPYIDSGGDGHQLIYLTVATAGSNAVMLTVTGDNAAVSAVIAVNFAAIAADEARATLIVDTNTDESTVAKMLRLDASDGIAEVALKRRQWSDVLRNARLGRDRSIDVVTSGSGSVPTPGLVSLLEEHGARLSRRYDAVVMVSSEEQVLGGVAQALPVADVLYCARVGVTSIETLKRAALEMKKAGANPRGLILWNAPDPILGEADAKGAKVRQKMEARELASR